MWSLTVEVLNPYEAIEAAVIERRKKAKKKKIDFINRLIRKK